LRSPPRQSAVASGTGCRTTRWCFRTPPRRSAARTAPAGRFDESITLPVGLVDRQIGLGVLEFLQEAILEDVRFVQVDREPAMHAQVSDVADFESAALTDF